MASLWSDDELKERAGEEVLVYVHELKVEVETHKARADAAVINAEQNCSLIEQKFLSLTEQYGQLEHEKQQIMATLERRAGELAQAQGKAHKLELDAITHSSDLDRVTFELSEARKSKRDLLDVVEQKNAELDEKTASMKSYLSKIVNLTNERSVLEGKVRDHDAEMIRSQSLQARLLQEKELLEQHNSWLNNELTAKVKGLMDERQSSADLEADLQSKLKQAEKVAGEARGLYQKSKERIVDLESKFAQTKEELRMTTEHALLQENHLSAEIATATKLADLYKQSSNDWSDKSNQLEGVIKAIEIHLNQVEAEYREKLDKEIQAREASFKEVAELKEKLDNMMSDRNLEIEKNVNTFALTAPPKKPSSEWLERQLASEVHGEGGQLPPVAWEISATALAATLLRDGWTLGKTYSKYHEAMDALRHESLARRNAEGTLEKVLREIEKKAEVILDEREEHDRLVEAYRNMEEKLHYSMGDQSILESTIKELKADLRKKDREVKVAYKEISDLQIQVAGLLRECADVKQRYEAGNSQQNGDAIPFLPPPEPDTSAADVVISENLVTFKDLRGIVEQNSKLRILVRSLSQEMEQKEADLKEMYSAELNKRAEVQASKVKEVLGQFKEKDEIIRTLHGTVALFKRLYEEKLNTVYPSQSQVKLGTDLTSPGDGRDYSRLLQSSQEEIRAVRNESGARVKALEDELAKSKLESTNVRIDRARVDAEGAVAREQMRTLTQNAENKRKEMDSVLLRNMEFSQTITNYQQRLRESSQGLHAAEELANRLKLEASILEKEKEILASAEKRASEEVVLLSDRAHRLQAQLDTFHSIEEARESVKATEIKKLQDEWSQMQKEWTEAKKELEVERRHSRDLTVLRDKAVKEATDRVETVSKELADALKAMSVAETRAQVAEMRCTEVEANLKKAEDKIVMALSGGKRGETGDKTSAEIDAEILSNLQEAREELDQTKEDLATARGHTEQYKLIAEANEEALKQLEAAHNRYKEDVDHVKQVLQGEIKSLQDRVAALESEVVEKETVISSTIEEKESVIGTSRQELATTQESLTAAQASLHESDARSKTLKEEVDKYHHQWREAQHNYERQILLQADTIRQLTITSDRLTKLEQEDAALRIQVETAESQLAALQVSWAMEKSSLESIVSEAEKKLKELEQQNRLLLDRLEAMHITAVEYGLKASAETGSNEASDSKGESDLQNVIRYLRRSKETAETEVALVKQERLRLQRQLDGALRAAEEAQASVRREQENARMNLCSEEEFRSLQAQVREINLMRESNSQLREENQRNFEDSRESRDQMRRAQAVLEPMQLQLREKDVELEASGKEIELQKAEVQRWQNRVSQLLEKYKAIDLEDYQRVKTGLSQAQDLLKSSQEERDAVKKEVEASQKFVEETRNRLAKVESDNNEKEIKLNELSKKLQDSIQAQTTTKGELERFKKHAQFLKRKVDNLTKEKDDLSKEKEALSKQAEDSKSTAGKRTTGEARQEAVRQEAVRQEAVRQEAVRQEAVRQETSLRQEALAKLEQVQKESENSLKEKETRIQLLEKTLERERESIKKEKALRQRDQKAFVEMAQKASQEKRRFLEELDTLKRGKLQHSESSGNGGDSEASTKTGIEERAVAYHVVVNALSEVAANALEQLGPINPAAPVASGPPVSQAAPPLIAEAARALAVDPMPATSETQTVPITVPSVTISVPSTSTAAFVNASAPASSVSPVGNTNPSIATVVTTAGASASRPPLRPSSSAPLPATRGPFRQPVIQSAGPDHREREMAQLRAQIQEKEKSQAQASVTQARKNARRLIRPRIEPEVVTELGVEVPGDATEADLEAEDEKLSTGLADAIEAAPVPQVTVVSSSAVPLDVSVTPFGTISISSSALQPPSSTQGKRPTASSEAIMEDTPMEAVKSEPTPQPKRPRPDDLPIEETPQDSITGAATSLTGSRPQNTSTIQEVPGQEDHGRLDLQTSDTSTVPEAPQESGTALISSEAERERPAGENIDGPPQKRLRFMNPPQLLRRDGVDAPSETIEEKTEPESDEIMSEADVKDNKSETLVFARTEDSLEEQKIEAVDIPTFSELVSVDESGASAEGLTGPGNADEGQLSAVARTFSLGGIMDLSQSVPEVGANQPGMPQRSLQDESAAPVIQVVSDYVKIETVSEQDGVMGKLGSQAETGGDEIQDIQDGALEEGQIMEDTLIPEALPSAEVVSIEVVEIPRGEKTAEEEERSAQHPVPSASASVAASQHVGDTHVQEPVVEEENITAPTEANAVGSEAISDSTASASAATQALPAPEQLVESSAILTRQSVKSTGATSNTTIHLADRARERAAVRRGTSNPQSPATRGRGRAARGGGKRAPGATRGGRVISTGVRGRGQQGGATEGLPEVGRGASQQAGPGAAASSTDQADQKTPANRYESLPREGED